MATVIGLFNTMDSAQRAVQALMDSGFRREDISVVARDERGEATHQHAVGSDHSAAEGAGAGAVGGTVVGGAIGLLVGAGLLAIPGIGPVLAAGPLAAAIGTTAAAAGAGALGAGIGAATGGLMGALIGAGVPEEEARYYSEGVQRGDVLVTVAVDSSSAASARDLLRRHGAADLESRGTSTATGIYDSSGYSDPDFARGKRDTVRPDTGPDYARGMHSFNDYDNDFRSHYRSTYGAGTRPYEDYAPAYRYGHSLAGDSRVHGERWEDVEADARRTWERDNPNTWEEFKDTVRYAWERARRAF